MVPEPSNRNEMGRLLAFSQVGMEMVAPIVLGWGIEWYLHCAPWGVVGGAVLGLIGGFAHLVHLLNENDSNQRPGPRQDSR